ncbi:MAG TPA: carboxypeptidase regulatory-like domain-containing protein [Terriglobales bacterium]|nr:carboxypeptidase regulatory-like domain-containing protein [Terriglobales bacterium]
MKECRRNFGLLAFMFVLFGVLAYGQAVDGNILGTVLDAQGAAVVGAEVSIENLATGVASTTKTNSTGGYRFDHLPVGTYRLTAKMTGFRPISEQVDIALNKTGTSNLTLTPGMATETVEVSGAAPSIDTTSAQLGSNYNTLFSQDLGITSAGGLGAGVLNLSLLSPGVTNANAMGAGSGPSVGGQRPRDNNFTIEGVDNNSKGVTGPLAQVPNDAVEGFTLLSNQFNAEFGHSSGGQFNTTVRSGTNSFHGSAYEYFRNRNLNAVDNSVVLQGLTSNPRFDSNRYGGTFGGPIIKGKLFFFTNFERQPVGQVTVGGPTVQTPTAAGLAAIAGDPNASATNLGIFQHFVPVAPAANGCIQFDGKLPNNEGGGTFSTFSAPANGTCAAGTIEVGNISIVPPSFINFQNFVQSVDLNISSNDQLRGRFVWNKIDNIDTAAQLPSFYAPQPTRNYLINLSEFHAFTPQLSNEFRVGFNRNNQSFPVLNTRYPGLDAFPNVTLFDLGGGLNLGPDPNAPQFAIQNFYQVVDNVSWVKGKHSLKFGGEYRWYISPQAFTQRARGDYQWHNSQLYLEDFSPDAFGQRSSGSTTYYGNQKAVYWYASDTFKVNSHLTLNAGLRYEYTTTPLGEDRQVLNAIANTPSIHVPQALGAPLVFNKPAAPKNNYAPRVGFAYSPGTSGSTSIRGGFGMAYDTLYDNIGVLAVPPQVGATTSTNPKDITAGFLSGGGLSGGGTGVTVLDRADAIANTANWIPPRVHDPYSVNWNFGIQHAFGKNYTAEVNYVGTHGVHLSFQDIINLQSDVTANHSLPTFLQNPGQAALDALPLSLNDLGNNPIPDIFNADAGGCPSVCAFNNNLLTAFLPLGSSIYHGLQTSLTRRMSNGLTFQASYTWSRTIDNSTADFHSTDLTPRRAQDFQNIAGERSVSALSRTHRLTIAAVYDLPFFKGGTWLEKNVLGNWQFSPVYTYESPEWVTPQSGIDSNLNIDNAGDRVILNAAGKRGVGSDVTPLCRTVADCSSSSAGPVVAYLAVNPNAQYITAGAGAFANSSRNILATRPTNNFDLGINKDLNITEGIKFRFGAQFSNLLNHPQLIPSSFPGAGLGVNDVTGFGSSGAGFQSYTRPSNAQFNNPFSVFGSNARSIALVAKVTF